MEIDFSVSVHEAVLSFSAIIDSMKEIMLSDEVCSMLNVP